MRPRLSFLVFLLCAVSFLSSPNGSCQTPDGSGKSKEEYFRIGSELERSRMFDEAISQFDRAIALDPKYVEAYVHKGLTLMEAGRYREAIECFRAVLGIDPTYTDAYVDIGRTYMKQGDVNKAEDVCDELAKTDEKKAEELRQEIQKGPVNIIKWP